MDFPLQVMTAAQDYWRDAFERSVLFFDVLRQRGNAYVERAEAFAPHVLKFKPQIVLDGRELPRPVNYLLVRIQPPEGVVTNPDKRPFIVFDPRAGHGPGIGGMKQDSEIGVALAAGHPCYFVGFLPDPMPDQTLADVCLAEARFVEHVGKLHPQAEGKPVLIGNCQAGWQIMIMAAMAPEIAGPIMLAGSPLSYWAGVRGRAPLRYLGGLLGGTWLTAFTGDMGKGIFDGAHLVANFESLNLANSLWQKPYNVFAKVDTEAERFLDFEKWWGSPILLNAVEMQQIADDLFVGNKLTSGELLARNGMRVDLRNIRSPIIVFCSWGDDITPPQQALGWILDLYGDEREIAAQGQTIVYCLHQTIGHLGIFVSGKVATKEHVEFANAMDLIDITPPGLYEAVITGIDENTAQSGLVGGEHLFRLERRTLDDIRALGTNSPEDDLRFATAARVSEINLELYRRFLSPLVNAMATDAGAEMMRHAHPNRMRFEMFSDQNPFMQVVAAMAARIREDRHPVHPENPLRKAETQVAEAVGQALDQLTKSRDTAEEALFMGIYGAPLVQALAGLGEQSPQGGRRMARDMAREAALARAASELYRRMAEGGPAVSVVRAFLYIRKGEAFMDERELAALRQIAGERGGQRVSFSRFKEIVREQSLLLQHDEAEALATLPLILPRDAETRRQLADMLTRMVAATGDLSPEQEERLATVKSLLEESPPVPQPEHAEQVRQESLH